MIANESTKPKWSISLGNAISRTTNHVAACCRRNTIDRYAKAKIDGTDPVKSAQVEYSANGKRNPSELAVISEATLEEGAEMQPICFGCFSDGPEALPCDVYEGDHTAVSLTGSINAGRMKIQRIRHSAATMPARTWTTESSRGKVFSKHTLFPSENEQLVT